MAAVPSPARPRRSQQLVADLLDMIQEGVVRPGTKLPTEAALAERFGVSRTVVREAIAQLRAAGVVRSTQGQGTFVLSVPGTGDPAYAPPAPDDLAGVLELLEFRMANEVEAAGLAAFRRTSPQLAQIVTALEQFAGAAGVPAAAVDADFAFHLGIARASGNRHFAALLSALGPGALAIPRARLRADASAHDRALAEHAAIADAIAAGDQLAAAAAMRTHLGNSRVRLSTG
jgi:GntR family transcriptional repressor for pyruvate dehydrogenase complex